MSETVKAIISDSDQWHPEAECANHDPIPEGEFHYVMPKGARVVELTYEYLPPMQDVVQHKPSGLPGEVRRLAQPTWDDGEDQ